jgi:hypothetical protein
MNEELRREIKQMIDEAIRQHIHSGTDARKVKLADTVYTPQDSIASPNGGATQDAQARTAIDSIITTLEHFNFVKDN